MLHHKVHKFPNFGVLLPLCPGHYVQLSYICSAFFSHFGAIRFQKLCRKRGLPATAMPVPRDLSSSCGTCVRYEGDALCPADQIPEEVEQIVEVTGDGYVFRYRAADS